MDKGSKSGPMALVMKDNGRTTGQMVKANSIMSRVMFMMEIGKMIRQMVLGFISISTEPSISDTGRMIYSMVLVKKSGLTVASI